MKIESIKKQENGYLVNGNTYVPISEGNKDFLEIKNAISNGFTVEPEFTSEELRQQLIDKFTDITDNFIQNRIDLYNVENGTKFKDVHNAESYSRVVGYPHQEWCGRVFNWSVEVWETVRNYQGTVTTPPTDQEFQSLLESVAF